MRVTQFRDEIDGGKTFFFGHPTAHVRSNDWSSTGVLAWSSVLSTRLRETAGIGRVGHRIRATLQRAVQLADVDVDGDFLVFGTTPLSEVRTSSPFQARSIEQVHSRELELAVHCVVRDAAGASRPDVVEAVSRALGWNRTSVAIAAVIAGAIDRLVAAGDLRAADLRLTIGKR